MLIEGLIIGGLMFVGRRLLDELRGPSPQKAEAKEDPDEASKSAAAEPPTTLEYDEKKTDRNLALALGTMGLTASAKLLTAPILGVLSIPIEVYLYAPFIKRGYEELSEDRRIGARTLDAVLSVSMLANGFFFASSLFFTLYNVSQKLLHRTRDNSKRRIVDIASQHPQFVWILRDDVEMELAFDALSVGQIVVVNAGETIPIDGVVTALGGTVDQRVLTGESQPVEKAPGDRVFAATVLLSGKLHVEVAQAGADTVAAKLGEILNRTADYKTGLESRGEAIADRLALPTLTLSAITLVALGPVSGVTVMLATFGYNMRIYAPINVLNVLGLATQHSVLVKDGRSLETLPSVDTVIFDKTGTLTEDRFSVAAVYGEPQTSEAEVLRFAAGAEYRQTHPLALAILEAAAARGLPLPDVEAASYEVGYGIKARIEGRLVRVGSAKFMEMEGLPISAALRAIEASCFEHGTALTYVATDGQVDGAIELQPVIRSEAESVIAELHARGLQVYVISGDHQAPTQALATRLGIDRYHAEVLPEQKAALVSRMQAEGRSVCFVGDGINDSIALKTADVSVSLRGASSIAVDTAQIVLMESNLRRLPWLFGLADSLDRNLKQSLVISVVPGLICVGGVLLMGWGVIQGQILYNIGLVTGVSNAMRKVQVKVRNKALATKS